MLKQLQLTMEEINLFDESELQCVSNEFGNGYGGYSIDDIFKELLPRGYLLKFIEILLYDYLCLLSKDKRMLTPTFNEVLEKYKNNPIIEYSEIKCDKCGKSIKGVVSYYERTGKLLNEKGKLL